MVLLVATERIRAAWEALPAPRRRELDLPVSLDPHGPISHAQLLRLAKCLQHDAGHNAAVESDQASGPTILSSLLRGSKVYVPPPPKKPEPSPEYLASKTRLLAAAEQAAYQRLLNPTQTPDPSTADPHATGDSAIIAEDTLTPSLVLNIFLSVIVTGFSVYWALSKFTMPDILARRFASWTGPEVGEPRQPGGASDAVRVLVSFFAALAVAVAETFLYAAYLGKVQRAKAKERRVKERKSFVGVVGDENAESVDGEEETIWGKGVNGGVRRRVREKWEKEKEKESDAQ